MNRTLWRGVESLLDRIASVEAASAHGVGPLVARRWRALGRDVPPLLADEEQFAMFCNLSAPVVIEHARAALDGPVLIFKGHEIARSYPDGTRMFGDVDLLVPDAPAAQRQLLAAGFVEVPDPDGIYVGIHHLNPLRHPSMALLALEIHAAPKWPDGARAPRLDELLEAAVPAACGIEGVLAPDPAHHALLLAAHGWEHEPLRQLRDVIDVAAAKDGLDEATLQWSARGWGIQKIWTTTARTADALFNGGRPPAAMRVWARHLPQARERTVLDNHLARWFSPFSARPAVPALGEALHSFGRDLAPAFDETWSEKIRRTVRAFAHALYPRSRHDDLLGPAAEKGQSRNVSTDPKRAL